jgi:hypothetical protein
MSASGLEAAVIPATALSVVGRVSPAGHTSASQPRAMQGAAAPLPIGIRDAAFVHLNDFDQASGFVPIPSRDFFLKLTHGRLLGLCCGDFL